MNRIKIMNAGQLARLLNSVPNDSAVTFRIDGQAAQGDTYEVVAETLSTRSLGVIKLYEAQEADTATQASVGARDLARAQHIATVAKKIGEGLEGRVRERANALVVADAPVWSSLIDSIAEVIVDEQFAFMDRLVESLTQAKARRTP